ncbi:MAG: hypothetical protein A2X28_00955 [Elusimicrobia bacterium GWA2_56_46]|nr:MAG: hypothetical protein A2X28_00955 [Elusimicrobia bacterium GWA2_56_46]OGR55931.1 MAG: hypothetical protein A2X39_06320 [Elusimicrobia bacterium GWC2_56_31]HBB67495.1 hypothetical protein [Elusimicrobiota bacterium]HBW22131.1 hypothetical protein [Elusimicrobiota bacterium]
MFLTRKSSNWTNIGYVKSSWRSLGGIVPERLVILDAVWKKEIGGLGKYCKLVGVNKGYVVIKTESSVAYNEILLRSGPIIKSLNKYFAKSWLKGIKNE